MPTQFEIAVQADDGQFRFLVASAGRLQRRAFRNPGHGLGIRHLELQFGSRRPRSQQPQPRFLAHHGQGHEHLERDLVLLAGRSADPGDIALAIALEIQEVFAGALVLGRLAKHGLVQPQRNPRPLIFADQDPKLDVQLGLSGRVDGSRGQHLLQAVARPLVALHELMLDLPGFLEIFQGEIGNRLKVALLVFQIIERRLGLFDPSRRCLRTLARGRLVLVHAAPVDRRPGPPAARTKPSSGTIPTRSGFVSVAAASNIARQFLRSSWPTWSAGVIYASAWVPFYGKQK